MKTILLITVLGITIGLLSACCNTGNSCPSMSQLNTCSACDYCSPANQTLWY